MNIEYVSMLYNDHSNFLVLLFENTLRCIVFFTALVKTLKRVERIKKLLNLRNSIVLNLAVIGLSKKTEHQGRQLNIDNSNGALRHGFC